MNDLQNIGLTHMDENHDCVKLYNATSKNETGNDHLNESIYPNNDNFCKYYTPDELIKTIGLENMHNITTYKNYCNVFNTIKRAAKKKYYTEIFAQNVNNIKRAWQLLHEALNKKPMHSKYEDAFLIGNIEVTNKKEIANGFNSFFANIGTTISDAVPQSTNAFSDYLTDNCQTNFFMNPTDEHEIINVTKNLKSSTSEGFDNI